MSAPLNVGDRVAIHGLNGRPDLNGQHGTVNGKAPNDRLTIAVEKTGEKVALKAANLTPAVSDDADARGSTPTPAMGRLLELAEKARERIHELPLPPQVAQQVAAMPTSQLLMGLALAVAGALFLATRVVPVQALGLVILTAYATMATSAGKGAMERLSVFASAKLGRQVTAQQAAGFLCLLAILGGKQLFARPASPSWAGSAAAAGGGAAGGAGGAGSLEAAYSEGYKAGKSGAPYNPPSGSYYPPSAAGKGGASMFSGAKLFRYAIVAQRIYGLGQTGGGWSAQVALEQAKANPMQIGLVLMMALM